MKVAAVLCNFVLLFVLASKSPAQTNWKSDWEKLVKAAVMSPSYERRCWNPSRKTGGTMQRTLVHLVGLSCLLTPAGTRQWR
jgi:hypothetical protein